MGITDGFCIGFNRRHSLRLSSKNLPTKNPSVIGNYLDREVQLGRMHRHIVSHPGVKLSPLGAISKKNKPGKWCLIMDLFSPAESSINDYVYRLSGHLSLMSLLITYHASSRSRQRGCPSQGRHQGGLQDAANLPG